MSDANKWDKLLDQVEQLHRDMWATANNCSQRELLCERIRARFGDLPIAPAPPQHPTQNLEALQEMARRLKALADKLGDGDTITLQLRKQGDPVSDEQPADVVLYNWLWQQMDRGES